MLRGEALPLVVRARNGTSGSSRTFAMSTSNTFVEAYREASGPGSGELLYSWRLSDYSTSTETHAEEFSLTLPALPTALLDDEDVEEGERLRFVIRPRTSSAAPLLRTANDHDLAYLTRDEDFDLDGLTNAEEA